MEDEIDTQKGKYQLLFQSLKEFDVDFDMYYYSAASGGQATRCQKFDNSPYLQ